MPRTNHKDARLCVQRTEHFNAHNLFSEEHNGNYIVFSYGRHYPLWVFNRATRKWYGNSVKYSPSTSRQQSMTRPSGEVEYKTTKELLSLIGI